MSVNTQEQIYIDDFKANIMHLGQQEASLLRNTVYIKPDVTGENFFQERIGQWAMERKAGSGSNTPLRDPKFSRRMGVMNDYDDGHPLDKQDEVRILADPMSAYTIAAGYAIGRQYDDVIIAAGLGTSLAGKGGTISVPLPSAQKIVNGSTNLTFEKVKKAARILNDNSIPKTDRYFVFSPAGLESLLGEAEATSSDYATVKALMRGELDTWMGFTWVESTRLPVASDIRSGMAFHMHGICLADALSPIVRIDERKDKSYLKQIYYALTCGAVRLE